MLCCCETPPAVLHEVVVSLTYEHGTVGTSLEEGRKADKKTGVFSVRRQAEKVGTVQTGEENFVWRPHSNLSVPEGT